MVDARARRASSRRAPRTALARRRMRAGARVRGRPRDAVARRGGRGTPGHAPVRRRSRSPTTRDGQRRDRVARPRPAGAPRVVVSLPPQELPAQAHRAACGGRGESRPGAGLRPRPPHAVQGRGALLRRAVVERNPARGTIDGRPRGGAPHGRSIPALKHVAAWGAEVVAVVPEPPAQRRVNRGSTSCRASCAVATAAARWQFWVPVVLLAALALAADRDPALAEARLRAAARRPRPTRRARAPRSRRRCAPSSTRAWRDYNFALERKYAFPGRARRGRHGEPSVLPDDTWLTQFELKTHGQGQGTQRDADAARRDGQRGPARAALRGVADLRAGRAARPDDQDPARSRRDLRPRRAVEAATPPAMVR